MKVGDIVRLRGQRREFAMTVINQCNNQLFVGGAPITEKYPAVTVAWLTRDGEYQQQVFPELAVEMILEERR